VLYYFTGVALIKALGDDEHRARLLKWILAILVFWLTDSLVQYIWGRDLLGIAVTPDGRVTGPFEGNLRQATFLAILMPLAIAALRRLPRGWVWALLFFAAAATIALLSGVRMVLVMLGVVVAGLFVHLPRTRWKWPLVAVLPAIAVVAVALSPTLKQRMTLFTEVQQLDFATADRLLSLRAGIWETGFNMMYDRPLTGVGAGAFEKAYKDYASRPGDVFARGEVRVHHAHQVYVSFAAETGVPGLIALIAVVVLGIRWYWRAPPGRRLKAWPYALALAVYFFPVNTQPPLFNHWLFPVLLLLFAAMLAALDDAAPDENTTPQT
jgi:O-antigen ligase